MLKYQKAKVKLLEYEVPEEEWPKFPLHYKDLAYPTVLAISQCAEAINDELDKKVTYKSLRYCSDFYDAAFQSREQRIHDADFALTGAVAHFFMDNFGSAKVLWQEVNPTEITNEAQKCLYELFSLTFTGKKLDGTNAVVLAIERFWENADKVAFNEIINEYRQSVFETDSPQTWF